MRGTAKQRVRRLIVIVAASAAALALPSVAHAETMKAMSAADFRDSIGINTHASYFDTAYGDWPRVVDKLESLGIEHLHDAAFANPDWGDWNERYYQAVELAAAHGMRFTVVMGEPNNPGGTLDQLIAIAAGRLHNAIDGLEGPNEYDLFHDSPNWPNELRDYQRALYAKAKADPVLRHLPLLGPSLVFPDSDPKLGPLPDALDAGNIHPYTGGDQPSAGHTNFQADEARRVSGTKPMWATEAGYHNALAASQGQPPVSEDVAASYVLRVYLEHFKAGLVRTYMYEAVDEKPDPALIEPESHFGLLRNDFSEKPAFTSLKRMLQLIGHPAETTPGTLDLGLGGDTTSVQHLLLKRSDNRYVLAFWQGEKEWDPQLRHPLFPPDRSVRLTLPTTAQVSVTRPTHGAGATSLGNLREVPLSVPADPTFVELEFPPGAKLPTGKPVVPGTGGGGTPGTGVPGTACPSLKPGGLVLEKAGVKARVRPDRSRRRTVRFELCANNGGNAMVEVRGAHGRLLAKRTLSTTGGREATVKVGWTKKSARAGLLKGRAVTARLRYLPEGATSAIVLAGRVAGLR
ncbi:MAG: hypothetical protein QOE06_1033 [Thermoleophilaceae bacterium]|jgi:hypothetical protein|nr:hypothetical protein [Thermoleophilaceae bacterium]